MIKFLYVRSKKNFKIYTINFFLYIQHLLISVKVAYRFKSLMVIIDNMYISRTKYSRMIDFLPCRARCSILRLLKLWPVNQQSTFQWKRLLSSASGLLFYYKSPNYTVVNRRFTSVNWQFTMVYNIYNDLQATFRLDEVTLFTSINNN